MEVSPLKKGVNGLMDYWKLCPTMDIGILLRVCAMWVVDAAVGDVAVTLGSDFVGSASFFYVVCFGCACCFECCAVALKKCSTLWP